MKDNNPYGHFLTEKPWPILGVDVPEWFNPEDEGSCIAATISSIASAIAEIDPEARCVCEPRFSMGLYERDKRS